MSQPGKIAELEPVILKRAEAPRAAGVPTGQSASAESKRPDATRVGLATALVLLFALVVLVPTVGDFGLTWDEPAYRYSQVMSSQWWVRLAAVRSWDDANDLFHPLSLLYYWPYGRHGFNFHPPFAGQLNLLAHEIFGNWMKDIPARRMATVLEFAATIALGFHFLARRYGVWVGLVMAGSLLFMPRLYGQAHLIDTDTPGLMLWAATALAFWKGLYEPVGRRWRVAVGVLLGLAFIEKMGAVMVLLPLGLWLVAESLARLFSRATTRNDWADAALSIGAMLAPLGLAFQQIQLLQQRLPPPNRTDFFNEQVTSDWPGAILALPLAVWIGRRILGWLRPRSKLWGAERPALETWTAILAFAPVVGWLGNPAWWRDTLPRLTHYYTLNIGRQGALPNIQIIYFGQIYEFSLPWHNAWILLAITVPVAILATGMIGLVWAVGRIGRDRLPVYFLVHFLALPVIRMFPTPAHDGVRLFLPTFFFFAAFAGWGTVWMADALARLTRIAPAYTRRALAAVVVGSSAFALASVHPYELSYYNELVGGPRGAWERGFELSYWYDAFTPQVLADLNQKFPPRAEVDFFNPQTDTSRWVFQELQTLGMLRGDIVLAAQSPGQFSYVWLLTQDSKAVAFTRLLFALRPWYSSRPPQLGGAQVAAVADPVAVSRAYALKTLLDAADTGWPQPPQAPGWVREYVPPLARLWGDGLIKPKRLTVNQQILDWSRTNPAGLLAAARHLAAHRSVQDNADAKKLLRILTGDVNPQGAQHYLLQQVLERRPEALVEAVQIINARRGDVVKVMTRQGYTDPDSIGGFLDRDLLAAGK
jgi:hypothetical protein